MPQTITSPRVDIDPAWTINETIRQLPVAIGVFNRFGVDTCCGGSATIEEAAACDGIDLAALLDALHEAARG